MAEDFDEKAIRQQIQRKIDLFVEGYNNKQFEKIVTSTFVPEAAIMSPGKPDVHYSEIPKRYENSYGSGSVRLKMKIDGMLVTPSQVAMKNRYWFYNAEGQERSHGAALVVWQKRNGNWFINYDMAWGEPSTPKEEK